MATTNETRNTVLDVAQEFVQTRGYNAFSFRDLADRVRIKSSSVHYYFPTKAELCRALIARQRERVASAFEAIDARGLDPREKLERYADIFGETLESGRMCLFGMLASDCSTLEPGIALVLRESFDDHEVWLERTLTDGRQAGSLRFEGDAREEARALLSSLEGAILLARTYEDHARFDSIRRRLLTKLWAEPQG